MREERASADLAGHCGGTPFDADRRATNVGSGANGSRSPHGAAEELARSESWEESGEEEGARSEPFRAGWLQPVHVVLLAASKHTQSRSVLHQVRVAEPSLLVVVVARHGSPFSSTRSLNSSAEACTRCRGAPAMLGWSAQLGNKLLCVPLLLSSSPPLDEPAPRPLASCQREEP